LVRLSFPGRKPLYWERQELRIKTLVDLTNKTNWQQENREHRYKYMGDNGKDTWRGLETITKTGESDQGVTKTCISRHSLSPF
jgi:hypothetical protein